PQGARTAEPAPRRAFGSASSAEPALTAAHTVSPLQSAARPVAGPGPAPGPAPASRPSGGAAADPAQNPGFGAGFGPAAGRRASPATGCDARPEARRPGGGRPPSACSGGGQTGARQRQSQRLARGRAAAPDQGRGP